MNPRTALTRALALGALAILALGGAACTPEEQAVVANNIQQQNAVLTAVRSQSSLTDDQLARLANCESGGNPRARSRSGKYFGLYQFNQGTWNGVAASVLPQYVGVSPADAPPAVQDAMARALYAARGRSPWPVCGRHL
ncbi:MAG: transglycosylase family protein [Acidimicrobiales bacterium]